MLLRVKSDKRLAGDRGKKKYTQKRKIPLQLRNGYFVTVRQFVNTTYNINSEDFNLRATQSDLFLENRHTSH
jgi:translation initiation factor IF-3